MVLISHSDMHDDDGLPQTYGWLVKHSHYLPIWADCRAESCTTATNKLINTSTALLTAVLISLTD
ncbi:hypothetical protein BBBOND_0101970 [Babesia bigemina]|uniref:Uncharacterized protein n=1 Tax=Babesia bigemina TaxID=5866 RepID=A0A061CZN6_BABBI|nr:hypothetical protein BBBOND_0101790 [Babesia bigemina]XP_012766054.1 hypothetical protein BBBOND_0101970 [Babesia bigemina]CDR93850.1 hypothetical protein BBBOND_0101790 [Babesia bigemina]CDR93868.1 hypothetical protein BBBOND_0101970 [Babesia bigemina]|eukprot:XP_012766036.1 hypothetical protein BBBOND_0101790 [Babesia bigemina]